MEAITLIANNLHVSDFGIIHLTLLKIHFIKVRKLIVRVLAVRRGFNDAIIKFP
mgnify:CR=1 FL=1